MPNPVFKSGKNSSALIAGSGTNWIEVPTTGWGVNPNQTLVSFKNSLTGTFEVLDSTFKNCTFSIALDYRVDANPYLPAGGGISLINGGSNTVRLLTDRVLGIAGGFWDFPVAYLQGNPMNTSTEGKPGVVANYRASGAWVEPAV